MKIPFVKYQGTGNDFVLVDNRDQQFVLGKDAIVKICDRKFGVGSDGVIFLENAGDTDFYMNFYNPDGSQSFCGNGSRCAVNFARSLGISKNLGRFNAIDGEHGFTVNDELVKIHMKDVQEISREGENFILNTGSPHYVIYKDEIQMLDILHHAREIRYSEKFKEQGINVNFVKEHDHMIDMRTYERGVEDETLSCGTGVTAAALTYGYKHPEAKKLSVMTRGGELEVHFTNQGSGRFSDIWLCGPAEFVFKGEIDTL